MQRTCPKCQAAMGALDQYCGFCGHQSGRLCIKCHHPVGSDQGFCGWCGQPVAKLPVDSPLAPEERQAIHVERSLDQLGTSEAETRAKLKEARIGLRLRELFELLALISGLGLLFYFGVPYYERLFNSVYEASPARGFTIAMGAAIALTLLLAMIVEIRRHALSAEVRELEERLRVIRDRRSFLAPPDRKG